MIKVSTIKLREDNPRMITEAALDKLGESIERDPEYMVIRPIVIDEDRVVLGGNQRLKAIIKLGKKTIPDKWVVQVKDWEEAKRKRFILVDNGPEGMSGTWDRELLMAKWDMEELEEAGISKESLKKMESSSGSMEDYYSRQIERPVYIPKRPDKPEISELADLSKYYRLIGEIEKAKLSKEEQEFLIYCATRHIVFDYHNIAEYYCHSSKKVQELMEKSVLVIIDFKRAIEDGYVNLSGEIADNFSKDNRADEA